MEQPNETQAEVQNNGKQQVEDQPQQESSTTDVSAKKFSLANIIPSLRHNFNELDQIFAAKETIFNSVKSKKPEIVVLGPGANAKVEESEIRDINEQIRIHNKYQKDLSHFDKCLIFAYTVITRLNFANMDEYEGLVKLFTIVFEELTKGPVNVSGMVGFDSYWGSFLCKTKNIEKDFLDNEELSQEEKLFRLRQFKIKFICRLQQLILNVKPTTAKLTVSKIIGATDECVKKSTDMFSLPIYGKNEILGTRPFCSFDLEKSKLSLEAHYPCSTGVVVEIPKGSLCLIISPRLSAHTGEVEVLLPFGSVFSFKHITQENVSVSADLQSTEVLSDPTQENIEGMSQPFYPKSQVKNTGEVEVIKRKVLHGKLLQSKYAVNKEGTFNDFQLAPIFWLGSKKDNISLILNDLELDHFDFSTKADRFSVLDDLSNNLDVKAYDLGFLSDVALYKCLSYSVFLYDNFDFGLSKDFESIGVFYRNHINQFVASVFQNVEPHLDHLKHIEPPKEKEHEPKPSEAVPESAPVLPATETEEEVVRKPKRKHSHKKKHHKKPVVESSSSDSDKADNESSSSSDEKETKKVKSKKHHH